MVKSAIKIFCRLKPSKSKNVLYDLGDESSKLDFVVPKDSTDGYVNNKKEVHSFEFQKVFDQSTTQDLIFDEVAKDVVDNVLKGYNGTIFAYGQTGSGKTYTITGGVEKYSDRGIIPRTLSYLFSKYKEQRDKMFSTDISYLEIYNECGYDLLDPKHEASRLEDLPKVTLMEDSNQSVHLKNMSVLTANTEEEALNLLFLGDTNRMVAETPMNQASTRSHCIFTVHVTSREPGSSVIKTSKLHLVDLAGSERVAKSNVGGQLLTEAKYINLSLHFLEQVIVALSEKKRQHIPYRNSMMTSVLRDSVGGNCMTTLIANVSIQKRNIEESISTCKFAQRVALIKNEVTINEELDPKLVISKLKQEIDSLKCELRLQVGDERLTDLTEEEKLRLQQVIKDYVESADSNSTLETNGDMRKIQFCFRRFKFLLNENKQIQAPPPAPQGKALNTVYNSEQFGDGFNLDDKQFERLREVLEQRDNEISILVNMLKKERIKNSSLSTLSSVPSVVEIIKNRNLQDGLTNAEAKNATFEMYKRGSESYSKVEDHKETLRLRYAEAKQLGADVNDSRNKINELKKIVAEINEELQNDPNNCDLLEEKETITRSLDDWREKYHGYFDRLRSMKTEIEHLHYILDKLRVQIQNEFEDWWRSQTVKKPRSNHYHQQNYHQQHQQPFVSSGYQHATGDFNPLSSDIALKQASAETSAAGSEPYLAVEPKPEGHRPISPASTEPPAGAHVPSTGDQQTDAAILAFFQARQTLMRNEGS